MNADMLSICLLSAAAVPLVLLAIHLLHHAWEHRSIEAEHHALLTKFHRERLGQPFHQVNGELSLRIAAAKIRERASAAVLEAPHRHREIVAEIVKSEVMSVGYIDKTLAAHLLAWAQSAGYDELLYADARRAAHAVMRSSIQHRRGDIKLHHVAALRIRN